MNLDQEGLYKGRSPLSDNGVSKGFAAGRTKVSRLSTNAS
jgi:hypothetical protein